MKPYKLKHIPTGLYFQPHKHRGSHLSKNGKIYQTKSNGIDNLRCNKETFTIYCEKGSQIHKKTKEKFDWQECKWSYNQLRAETRSLDWLKEEI